MLPAETCVVYLNKININPLLNRSSRTVFICNNHPSTKVRRETSSSITVVAPTKKSICPIQCATNPNSWCKTPTPTRNAVTSITSNDSSDKTTHNNPTATNLISPSKCNTRNTAKYTTTIHYTEKGGTQDNYDQELIQPNQSIPPNTTTDTPDS